MKVSPGGSHLGASWSKRSEPNVILGFRVPTTIGLRKPPARSPCSQSMPGSLERAKCYTGSLEPSWSLRKPPARSPCSQLAPLAPRACLGPWSELGASWSKPNVILGPWNLPGASESPQLAPLAPLTPSLLPEHAWVPGVSQMLSWVPGTFLEPQEAPSSLPLLPVRSRDPGMLSEQGKLSMYLGPYHLFGARWEQAEPCSRHSPHFQLAGPRSQCPMTSLVCIGVPTTSGGKGVGGKVGGSWSWLPSPQITPHAPACSQWPMYVWGSPPPLGCKGLGGKVGASWSKLGSKLSEPNVILGFRIPTTFGR